MVVNRMLMSWGEVAWKLATSRMFTRLSLMTMEGANRYFGDAALRKLSRVLLMMLALFTKNRKLR